MAKNLPESDSMNKKNMSMLNSKRTPYSDSNVIMVIPLDVRPGDERGDETSDILGDGSLL